MYTVLSFSLPIHCTLFMLLPLTRFTRKESFSCSKSHSLHFLPDQDYRVIIHKFNNFCIMLIAAESREIFFSGEMRTGKPAIIKSLQQYRCKMLLQPPPALKTVLKRRPALTPLALVTRRKCIFR